MFEEVAGEIPWASAVRCASRTMKNKIISSEDDLIGVMFYNTAKDRNIANFKGIYQLQKLDIPDAERIRELEDFFKNPELFQKAIGSSDEEAVLGNVFWACSSLFGPLKRKPGSKRVFLFTNNDEPHAGNVGMQRAAKIRARDLSDLGIFVELFELSKPGSQFNLACFYTDVLPLPLDEDDETVSTAYTAESSAKFAELMVKVRRRESRKRALGKMPMVFGEGMSIAIRVYSLYMEAKKGQYVWMEENTGKLAKPVTEWIESSTGASISRQELGYYYDFGGERAPFSKEELLQVKSLGQPSLTILGFRPRSWLKPFYNLTHSSFIFPDESEVRGSIVAFRALLDGMLELEQLAICTYVPRRTVTPRLVALLPQAEVIDPDTSAQVKPPGMHIIILPFSDELRSLHYEGELETAESELVDKAKEIVSKLTISGGFDPEAFENPVLQRHYASLQALALDQELEEEDLKDSLEPDAARMQKRAGTMIQEFVSMLPVIEQSATAKPTRKRAAAADADERPVDVASISGDANKLSRLTVPVLKEYAQSIGIKPARNKAELILQIVDRSMKV